MRACYHNAGPIKHDATSIAPIRCGLRSDEQEDIPNVLHGLDPGLAVAPAHMLKPAVAAFYDKGMVMARAAAVKHARVRLLMDVAGLFDRVADFAQIQSEI